MASEVDLVNSALYKVGADRIESLTEGSRNADIASLLFVEVRDDMLRAHPWNFATRKIKLARSANSPPYEWDYQFPKPADHVRTMEVHDNDAGLGLVEYRMEHDINDGEVFRTNAEELWLTYVAKITDPAKMPPDFRRALSLKLAVELAVAIAESNTRSAQLEPQAESAFRKARSTDSMEDFPEQMPAGTWFTSRFTDYDTGR